jgi:cytochrome c-type biogenesis protein CcmH
MKSLMRVVLYFSWLFLFSNLSLANDAPVEFKNDSDKERYETLNEEIRCLVCQNQSLADSHAELAQDLRKQVYDMIVSGKDNNEIKQFLVERYGDFVLYRPPLKENTWLLWFSPFAFLLIGLIIAIVIIRKQSNSSASATEIDEQQKQRLAELLDEESKGSKE